MGEGYRHLFFREQRAPQPEPDEARLQLFAVAESVSDAKRALRRARERFASPYRRDLLAAEQLVQELMLSILNEANGSNHKEEGHNE